MPNILYPPPRPQSVGEILDSAFRIFGVTLLRCLPYSFLGVIVGHLTTFYDLATGHPVVPTTLRARQTHRSEEHTSELQSQSNLVCRLLLEKKKIIYMAHPYTPATD